MFYLRDLPKYETIRQRAERYPQIDPRALEACLVLLRVGTDLADAFDAYLLSHGISQSKFTVLMILNRDPGQGQSPSDLADRSGVTRATMTGLLDGLEREQLVRREADPDDRRKAVVRLTPRAAELLEQILPDYFRQLTAVMGALAEEEKQRLVELLMQVNSRLPGLWTAAGRSGPSAVEGV